MTNLTDFSQTDDVSDAAIEWVSLAIGEENGPDTIRKCLDSMWAQTHVLAARLIQQHRPDLLVDPVDAIIDNELRTLGYLKSENDYNRHFSIAKRLYLMGKEASK